MFTGENNSLDEDEPVSDFILFKSIHPSQVVILQL